MLEVIGRAGMLHVARIELIIITTGLLFVASPAVALTGTDADARVASNQAISLGTDQETPGATQQPVLPPLGSEEAERGPNPDLEVAGEDVLHRENSGQSRFVTPRRSHRESLTQLSDSSRPWYRVGLVPLMIVLVVVGAVFLLVRRWSPSARSTGGDVLRIVARTALGPKQSVMLMRVGRTFVLLGVTPDRIEALGAIDDPEEVGDLAARTQSATISGRCDRFSQLLLTETEGFKEPDAPSEPLEAGARSWPTVSERVSGASRQISSLLGKLKKLRAG
jgi:flagellar biosynthetic protein FliO